MEYYTVLIMLYAHLFNESIGIYRHFEQCIIIAVEQQRRIEGD